VEIVNERSSAGELGSASDVFTPEAESKEKHGVWDPMP